MTRRSEMLALAALLAAVLIAIPLLIGAKLWMLSGVIPA